MQLDEYEITKIINTVEKAVSNSWAREVFTVDDRSDPPKRLVNQIPFQIYLSVLSAVIQRMEQVEIVHTPPPSELEI